MYVYEWSFFLRTRRKQQPVVAVESRWAVRAPLLYSTIALYAQLVDRRHNKRERLHYTYNTAIYYNEYALKCILYDRTYNIITNALKILTELVYSKLLL